MSNWTSWKSKHFVHEKTLSWSTKATHRMGENIRKSYNWEGANSRIYRELLRCNTRGTPATWSKNGHRTWTDASPTSTREMRNSSRQQGDANQSPAHTHLGWWLPKNWKSSVGKDVERLEPLCLVGGDISWCSHCGKQYGSSSKKFKVGHPEIHHVRCWVWTRPKKWKQGLREIVVRPCSSCIIPNS